MYMHPPDVKELKKVAIWFSNTMPSSLHQRKSHIQYRINVKEYLINRLSKKRSCLFPFWDSFLCGDYLPRRRWHHILDMGCRPRMSKHASMMLAVASVRIMRGMLILTISPERTRKYNQRVLLNLFILTLAKKMPDNFVKSVTRKHCWVIFGKDT